MECGLRRLDIFFHDVCWLQTVYADGELSSFHVERVLFGTPLQYSVWSLVCSFKWSSLWTLTQEHMGCCAEILRDVEGSFVGVPGCRLRCELVHMSAESACEVRDVTGRVV